MLRFITPVILIGVAIAGFFLFTTPQYQDISVLRTQVASYNEALDNSKALESERDKLTTKYNAISPENLEKLSKMLPDNVDNIRLILEIEKVAGPYGMVLKDIQYNAAPADTTTTAPAGIAQAPDATSASAKDYGSWDLEFSTVGTYTNFLAFIKALDTNLRIVDISSINFSSSAGSSSAGTAGGVSPSSSPSDVYKYDFKITTYWLKN